MSNGIKYVCLCDGCKRAFAVILEPMCPEGEIKNAPKPGDSLLCPFCGDEIAEEEEEDPDDDKDTLIETYTMKEQ